MLNTNLLYRMVIDPGTGKVVREETFLGAVAASIMFAVGLIAIVGLAAHFGIL